MRSLHIHHYNTHTYFRVYNQKIISTQLQKNMHCILELNMATVNQLLLAIYIAPFDVLLNCKVKLACML